MTPKANPQEPEDITAAHELRRQLVAFNAGAATRAELSAVDVATMAEIRKTAGEFARVCSQSTSFTVSDTAGPARPDLIANQVSEYFKLMTGHQKVSVEGTELETPAIDSAPIRTHIAAMGNNIARWISSYVDQRASAIRQREEYERTQDDILERALKAKLIGPQLRFYEDLHAIVRGGSEHETRLRLAMGAAAHAIEMVLPIVPQLEGVTWAGLSEAIERHAN